MKNPRASRRKEILKIREEINAKETKETIAKLNKAKSWFFEKINKIQTESNNILKGSYIMTKWALSQGCKDSSIFRNQSV